MEVRTLRHDMPAKVMTVLSVRVELDQVDTTKDISSISLPCPT